MDIIKHIENFQKKYPDISLIDLNNFLYDVGLMKNVNPTSIHLVRSFYDACDDGDINIIKKCISENMPITYYSNFIKINAVSHVAQRGHIDALDFFLKDSLIQNHAIHRKEANLNDLALEMFSYACENKILKTLNHLINEYNVENKVEIRDYIKTKCGEEMRRDIIGLIENKHLKYILELSLDNSTPQIKKLKV